MIDPRAPRMTGIECLREAIATVPIPGAPPRLSKDGAAVGLAFLDIALRQNHIRRLTERLTLIEHRTARCSTEVDISLGMLDQEQIEAGLLYQRIRRRGAPDLRSVNADREDVHRPAENVIWVPVSLARRGHAPVDVIDGEGVKLPRLTQYETSRLLASAMYRLLRLILSAHPDVAEPVDKPLYDFLHRVDKPRWLVQAALVTLLTERNKPAARSEPRERTEGTIDGIDADYRATALDVFRRYESSLQHYFSLLDLAVNDYLLVVALNPSKDEHLLAFDSPLHVDDRLERSLLRPFRSVSGAYWAEYRTRLPANLRAYHLVAETEQTLEIDTMCLTSNADASIVGRLEKDLTTLATEVREERQHPTGRRGEKKLELELQGCLRRLSELMRRRRWEATKAGLRLAGVQLAAAHALEHAACSGEALENRRRQPHSSLFRHALVTPENLAQAADEIKQQELRQDLGLESEPPSQRAHVYWRRDPSRTDLKDNIYISANMFIKDTSGSRPGSIIAYVLSVVGIAYLLGCLRFDTLWPFYGSGPMRGPINADAIIAVLLLVPGFLYTRLNLPHRQSIAGQLRRLPRLVAHVTIFAAAALAAIVAGTEDAALIRIGLAACVVVPLLAVAVMLMSSRAVVQDLLPVTTKLPMWTRTGVPLKPGVRGSGRLADWWWRRSGTNPDAVFRTTSVESVRVAEGNLGQAPDTFPPEVGGELVSPRSLAALARAGFTIVRQPLMRVAYEVHHVNDHAGYLYGLLKDRQSPQRPEPGQPHRSDTPAAATTDELPPERFIETLTTAAHGTGLVIGTRTVSAGADAPSTLGGENPVSVESVLGKARRFSGSALPDVSFVYDSSHVFEGLIGFGSRDTPLQRRHGRAILEVMSKVAELAADVAHAPILSLQSPVQLPPPAYAETPSDDDGDEKPQEAKPRSWPRASSMAVRFSIALARPTARLRLRLVDTLAKLCGDSGFALWTADTRSGYRAGNWFSICRHDPERLAAYFERYAEEDDTAPPRRVVPITLVGPARVGAVKSVVRYLRCYPQVGVAACSMSIVDDVSFIHLQLTAEPVERMDAGDLNRSLDQLTHDPADAARLRHTEPAHLLPELLSLLAGAPLEPPPRQTAADLARKVNDFHLLVGPSTAVPHNADRLRRALWVAWEVEGQEAELSVPFLALYEVLQRLQPEWTDDRQRRDDPNVEYLICRRVRHAVLRGKGKISFPNRIQPIIAKDDLQAGLSAFSERIEEAWRGKLDPTHRVRELTVSWRENWLGHWTSPLD